MAERTDYVSRANLSPFQAFGVDSGRGKLMSTVAAGAQQTARAYNTLGDVARVSFHEAQNWADKMAEEDAKRAALTDVEGGAFKPRSGETIYDKAYDRVGLAAQATLLEADASIQLARMRLEFRRDPEGFGKAVENYRTATEEKLPQELRIPFRTSLVGEAARYRAHIEGELKTTTLRENAATIIEGLERVEVGAFNAARSGNVAGAQAQAQQFMERSAALVPAGIDPVTVQALNHKFQREILVQAHLGDFDRAANSGNGLSWATSARQRLTDLTPDEQDKVIGYANAQNSHRHAMAVQSRQLAILETKMAQERTYVSLVATLDNPEMSPEEKYSHITMTALKGKIDDQQYISLRSMLKEGKLEGVQDPRVTNLFAMLANKNALNADLVDTAFREGRISLSAYEKFSAGIKQRAGGGGILDTDLANQMRTQVQQIVTGIPAGTITSLPGINLEDNPAIRGAMAVAQYNDYLLRNVDPKTAADLSIQQFAKTEIRRHMQDLSNRADARLRQMPRYSTPEDATKAFARGELDEKGYIDEMAKHEKWLPSPPSKKWTEGLPGWLQQGKGVTP